MNAKRSQFHTLYGAGPWVLAGALLIASVILFAAGTSIASEVVCSVCGKSFPSDTEKCPNDGTDLKKLGIKISEDKDAAKSGSAGAGPADPEAEKAEPDGAEEEKPLPSDEAADSSASSLDKDDSAKPIYKRRRRIIKSSGSSYSDRRSRVSIRRGRGAESGEEQDEEQKRFLEQDEKRLARYEIQRRQAEALRLRIEIVEQKARQNRRAERQRLLYGLGAPLTSVGFRMFWMGERNDPGAVNTIEIDLNLARYRFRAGFSTLIGVRSLSGRNELVFLEHVSVGFQWPWRYSPYVVLRGGVGVLANERFGVSFVNLLTSVGAEIGIDSWVTPWIAITPSVGYARTMVDNAYWNSFTFKIALGF